MARCKGFCGSVLHRTALLVKLMPESKPKPAFKPLGACVGAFVLCPNLFLRDMGTARERTEACGEKAQAQWDIDLGHSVRCGQCGTLAYPGDTLVEVVGA